MVVAGAELLQLPRKKKPVANNRLHELCRACPWMLCRGGRWALPSMICRQGFELCRVRHGGFVGAFVGCFALDDLPSRIRALQGSPWWICRGGRWALPSMICRQGFELCRACPWMLCRGGRWALPCLPVVGSLGRSLWIGILSGRSSRLLQSFAGVRPRCFAVVVAGAELLQLPRKKKPVANNRLHELCRVRPVGHAPHGIKRVARVCRPPMG